MAMPGNDRRTALLGCLEKIRELIASFFRAFAQAGVHHLLVSETTVQHRTASVNNIRPPAPLGRSLGSAHRPHFSGRKLNRKNHDKERRDGGVHDNDQTGTTSIIGRIDGDWKIISLPPASAEFAVLFRVVAFWRSLGESNPCFSLERGTACTLANVGERLQTQRFQLFSSLMYAKVFCDSRPCFEEKLKKPNRRAWPVLHEIHLSKLERRERD
jgi:hypothetical protein